MSVSGRVVSETDANGNATGVGFTFNSLPIPLQLGLVFKPMLAVDNVTRDNTGGTVRVEDSEQNNDYAGPFMGATAHGTAASGYALNLKSIKIRDLNDKDGEGYSVDITAKGMFSAEINGIVVTGHVVRKKDGNGNVTSAEFIFDDLPMPLQLDLAFVAIAADDDQSNRGEGQGAPLSPIDQADNVPDNDVNVPDSDVNVPDSDVNVPEHTETTDETDNAAASGSDGSVNNGVDPGASDNQGSSDAHSNVNGSGASSDDVYPGSPGSEAGSPSAPGLETGANSDAGEPSGSSSSVVKTPQTGDETPIGPLIVLALVSFAGAALTWRRTGKSRRNK